MKRYLVTLVILLSAISGVYAQSVRPEVVFQSGFLSNVKVNFSFSPHGKYIAGLNEQMEYIIWDVKTGRQIKKINKDMIDLIPKFSYVPNYVFSDDETQMLHPDFPNGNYILFDIVANKNVHVFKPQRENQWFTDAQFSADGTKIMIVGQSQGADHVCELYVFSRTGKLLSVSSLELPSLDFGAADLLMKIFYRKAIKSLDLVAYLKHIVYDEARERIYISLLDGKVYWLGLNAQTKSYTKNDLRRFDGLGRYFSASQMSLYKKKLILKGELIANSPDSVTTLLRDTLYVIDMGSRRPEKKVVTEYLVLGRKYRSNAVNTLPITSDQNLSTYSSVKRNGLFNYELTVKDILTDNYVFSYKTGALHGFDTNIPYQGGVFNGGQLVAISPDHQLMAECSRDLLIHNLKSKEVMSYASLAKGQMKIGAPLYLDSTRVLIPKSYNDGFVLNVKDGTVDFLKRDIDDQDTLNNGYAAYFSYDNNAQIGIQNAAPSRFSGQFATTLLIPINKRGKKSSKSISTWDNRSLAKLETYVFDDQEPTSHLNTMEGYPKRFLVNHKLFSFEEAQPKVVELILKQKRDTFYAVNPVYLPRQKQIFAMAGTRTKPGNPDLQFITWDADGKMLKTVTHKREKSNLEYQTLVFEAVFSPDSTKLLFGLFDGTAGIYDLKLNKVTSIYEHGSYFEVKAAKIFVHTRIYAACFIDDKHFLTSGDDNRVLRWTVGKSTPDGVLNKKPVDLLSMSISPQKTHLLGVDYNKTLHFINLATGLTDLDFVTTNRESYTMVNNDGYYMTNKKSATDISFMYNGNAYGFSQFDLALNRPDQVMKSLGMADKEDLSYMHKAWERRVTDMGYKPALIGDLQNLEAPEIELSDVPELGLGTKAATLDFNLHTLNVKYPPLRLMINVNGVPLYGANGKVITKEPEKLVAKTKPVATVKKEAFRSGGLSGSYSVSRQQQAVPEKKKDGIPVSIPLSSGQNLIEVSVVNAMGTESLQQSLRVERSKSLKKPNLYLVAIGVGTYSNALRNLKYAAKDARDVVKLFKQNEAQYNAVFIDTLIDAKVTAANVLKMKTRLQNSDPDDLVVLYYAGHGLLDQKLNYYLSTPLTNFEKPELNSISYETLSGLLDGIPARNKLLLLDACYSGEVNKMTFSAGSADEQEKVFELHKQLFSDLRRSSGASEIGASGPAGESFEGKELENGVFTYFLKKGLGERLADIDKDGQVKVTELAEYLRKEVFNYTREFQQPTIRKQNIINDMVLWK